MAKLRRNEPRMQFLWLSLALVFTLIVTVASQSGLLPQSSCHQPQDCYVIPRVLELACYYNVNKCNCQTTIQSIHHVESVNGECLMSKYGPCGTNGAGATVGCLDGFKCVDNQCRDPKQTPGTVNRGREQPFEFQRPCRNGCTFSTGSGDPLSGLRFQCGVGGNCVCRHLMPADARSPIWDVRNYDGLHNCSVGKFGPCGSREGIQIDCHGAGIECVNGRCIDAKNPIAGAGGACELTSDCATGLICGGGRTCIARKSLGYNERCKSDEECSGNLVCRFNTPGGGFPFGRGRVCAPPL